jgi:adhesin/invasin
MLRRALFLHPIARITALAFLAACGETGPSEQIPPAAINNVTGVPLQGPAGDVLAERVIVRVVDAASNPLPGVTVTFTAAAGGSVSPATSVTNDDGEASTRWTLGPTPGNQALSVSAGGQSVQITATAGSPRIASLAVNAGNNQTGGTSTALPTAPSVITRNATGAPVAGVTVFFTVLSGGGSVAQASAVSNAQGIASAGSWTLGATTGTQLLSAQVPQAGVTNNPIVFTATATGGAPASVAALSATQQTTPVSSLVASLPSVIVRDAAGNSVANVNVVFAVTSGGGQLTGATQTTNSQGVATVGSWRVGAATGTNTVTATVAGVAPVTFTAIGAAGTPTQLIITAGDNQSAPVNRPVPIAPQVRVVDAAGNGVVDIPVTFTIGSGDGSVIVGNVVTGSDGRATVGAWILGTTLGLHTLVASAPNLGQVTFTATATGGAAASMQPISLVSQPGIAGQAATSIPSVVVRDAQGNPVAGVTVTFSVTAGGGTVTGGTVVTDASGVATATSWTFGVTAGLNTVTASAAGLPSVIFSSTTTGIPTQVAVFNGNNQAAVQGTAVAIAPSVRVTDVGGQGVGGVPVTFAVTGGGGSLTGPSVLTDATGVATVGSWTLGAAATQTLSATVTATGTIAGNPVTFTATAATQLAITQQPPANVASGVNFTVTVQLRNASNALAQVSGVPLTISVASGGGTLNGTTTVNTVAGTATFTVNFTTNGSRTLQISGAGVTSVTTTTVTTP